MVDLEVASEILNCGECGISFAVPEGWSNEKRQDHSGFYCPNGHGRYFPDKSKEEKLKAELEIERSRADYNSERANRLDRSLSAQKGVTKRIKNRIKSGACPCCNRSFVNMARHMKTKHPEYGESAGG